MTSESTSERSFDKLFCVGEIYCISNISILFRSLFFVLFRWFQGFDWENLSNLTLKPPRISCVNGPLDLTNFDVYPNETELPPDETSGWDADF